MGNIKEMWKQYNPLFLRKKKILRDNLINKEFTLITSNCIGGIIYHEYGLRFLSPTINVRFSSKQFVEFVSHLKKYLQMELNFVPTDEPYPVAILGGVIRINFVHYESEKDAARKWEERKKRINWDNIFIITNDCDGVTEEDIRILDRLPYHVCVFTSKNYADINSAIYVKCYKGKKHVGNFLKQNILTGKRVYEKYIDITKWLNTGIL